MWNETLTPGFPQIVSFVITIQLLSPNNAALKSAVFAPQSAAPVEPSAAPDAVLTKIKPVSVVTSISKLQTCLPSDNVSSNLQTVPGQPAAPSTPQ